MGSSSTSPRSYRQVNGVSVASTRTDTGRERKRSPAFRISAPGSRPASHRDRKSTRLNSSHGYISYAVFCLKKKKKRRPDVAQWVHRRVRGASSLCTVLLAQSAL